MAHCDGLGEEQEKRTRAVHDALLPAMDRTRQACDSVEGLVSSDLWPLPGYTDLLFSSLA